MEDLYSIHPAIPRSSEKHSRDGGVQRNDSDRSSDDAEIPTTRGLSDLIRAQIATHPLYPSLVSAFIDCRKVGAPPEVATLLEEIGRGEESCAAGSCGELRAGADPELDKFMESYCHVLVRYKDELSKPFHEATSFLTKIEMELSDLCKAATTSTSTITTTTAGNSFSVLQNLVSDEAAASSEEGLSCEDDEASKSQEGCSELGDQELKEMLLRKYSGYLSSLKKDFMKNRKKGNLPKDARFALLDWWNTHYRWPYPTEEEKTSLAEMTGLDQKQINNWFINQRKRHWKPSEDMQLALMEGVSRGGTSGTTTIYFDTGTIGP